MAAPGAILNISTADGFNHFNEGIGLPSGHVDHTIAEIAGGYSSTPEFVGIESDAWCQFRVRMDGKTTSSGTKYPRSELRELSEDGSSNASWNGASGTHYMEGISRIDHLPPSKPWVVFCQLHDASSDLVRVQTEGTPGALKIVARNTPPGGSTETATTVMASYTLGTPISWRIEVINGNGKIYLNGAQVSTFPASEAGLYFKCGAYAQSNSTIDAASEYASVAIKRDSLQTWHTGYPTPKAGTGIAATSGTTPPGGGGTTPPAVTTRTNIALASCWNSTTTPPAFARWSALSGTDKITDLWITGDLIYNDGAAVSTYQSLVTAKLNNAALVTLRNSLTDPEVDFKWTWSDHDSTLNSNGTGLQYPAAIANANSVFRTLFPNLTMPSSGIYETWVKGRVRYIKLDERTFKSINTATDNSSKTILGATQKAWFKNLLASSAYPVICIIADVPMVGTTTADDDGWKGYNTERVEMVAAFNASPAFLVRVNGDMHCLARATNNTYGLDRQYQVAPLDNDTKVKESGAGLAASYPTNGSSLEGTVIKMYGTLSFVDDTQSIAITFKGFTADDNVLRVSDTVTVAAPSSGTGDPTPPVGSGDAPIYNVRVGDTAIAKNAAAAPALPVSLTLGDLLLVRSTVIRFTTASVPAQPGTPAGWTLKNTATATLAHATMRFSWYYARWDPSGVNGVNVAPSFSYSGLAADEHHAQIVACTRALATGDPTDVLGALGVAAAASTSTIGPATGITTTKSGDLVLGVIACEYDPTTAMPAFTGPEGLTWAIADEHGNGVSNTWGYGYDTTIQPAAGAIADKNLAVTQATAGKSVGQMWAIRPASNTTVVTRVATVRWRVVGRAVAPTGRARWSVKGVAPSARLVRFGSRNVRALTRRVRFGNRIRAGLARVVLFRSRNTVPKTTAGVRWSVRKLAGLTARPRFAVRKLVARTRQVRFKLKALGTGLRPVRFGIRTRYRLVTTNRWGVRRRLAGPTAAVRWRVRASRLATRLVRFRVRGTQRVTPAVRWSVRTRFRMVAVARWGVRGAALRKIAVLAWRVRGLSRVTRVARWKVRGRALAARTVRFALSAPSRATRTVRFNTRADRPVLRAVRFGVRVPAEQVTRSARWAVRRRVRTSGVVRWFTTAAPGRVGRSAALLWRSKAHLTATPRARFAVRGRATDTAAARWRVTNRVGATRRARWHVRLVRTVTVRARFRVRGLQSALTHPVSWAVRTRTVRTARARWSVRGRTARARVARWSVRIRAVRAQTARWSVRVAPGRARGLLWRTRAPIRVTARARWSVRIRAARARVARYRVRAVRRGSRVLAWDLSRLIRPVRVVRWGMRRQTRATARVRWAADGPVQVTRRVRWRIVTTADQALIPGRLTVKVEGASLGATAGRATVETTSRLSATVDTR